MRSPYVSTFCLTLFICLDYAVIGSDSGRLVVLDYYPKTRSFAKLHQEAFRKSGARRIVPGQYLATDPKGQAVTIVAMEKAKLVYILNRDAAVNPMFAALEVDYSESDQDPTGEAFNIKQKRHVSDSLPLQLN